MSAKVKKYDLTGKQIGEVEVTDALVNFETNSQLIKDYIVAIRENNRQWSASTKGRSDVKHTTKKSHPQKGTGRARHGSLVATQFRGGGIPFGPRPKFNQHVRINKKERQAAVRSLIAEKVKSGHLHVLASTSMQAPRTAAVAGFLKELGLSKRVLFIGEGEYRKIEVEGHTQEVSVSSKKHQNFTLSVSNIGKAEFSLAANISGYDIIKASDLVITEEALKQIENRLS